MIFFPTNLRCLREKKGLTQSQLAEKLGVKANTISNYEKGNSSPDFKSLGVLVEIFDIDAHSFLYADLRETPPAGTEPAAGADHIDHPQAGLSAPHTANLPQAGYDDELRKMKEDIEGLKETVHELIEGINR